MQEILIIDDNKDLIDSLKDILTQGGYLVRSCLGINEAKMEMNSKMPDSIICDINLPDGNGIDFISQLKSDKPTEQIPLILITGDQDRTTFRKGMINGADDYITKPFSTGEILDSVNLVIKKYENREVLNNKVKAKLKEINHINSHELRHGVSSLQGLLTLISDDDLDVKECGAYFDQINVQLEESISKLNDVLHEEE